MPLRIALEKSLNLVTLRVAQKVGMEAVAQNGDRLPRRRQHAAGAAGGARRGGDHGAAAWPAAYAVARRGRAGGGADADRQRAGPRRPCGLARTGPGVRRLRRPGPTPPELADDRRQIADPASVFQIVTMMQGVVQRGTGYAAGKGLNRPIAGKTGTTQDFNDAWFVGFTPDLVTAVWIGFDTPPASARRRPAATIAAPIWHDYMATALKDRPVLDFPHAAGRDDGALGQRLRHAHRRLQAGPGAGRLRADRRRRRRRRAVERRPATRQPCRAGGVDSGMGGLY